MIFGVTNGRKMKAKHILKDIKGKTITEAINNLKEIESLGFGNEKINVKVNASVRGFTISSDIKIFIEIKGKHANNN